MAPSLTEWESFYVITGSSGAALTGLMFVVITLATERMPSTQRSSTGMSIYSTPTLVHFSVVLMIAALMTIPHQTFVTLAAGLGLAAGIGVAYTVANVVRMRRLTLYTPVAEDWIFHGILPVTAYLSLLASAIVIGTGNDSAFFVIAAIVLLLLFIGIHNAWDVALYAAMSGGGQAEQGASAP